MKSNKSTQFTRRKFVGGMLRGMLAAAVAPRFIPMRLLAGETAPSKRIQLGHIGVGFKGTGNLNNFLSQSDISTCVAICDPYRERLEAAGALVKKAKGTDPKLYNDFRELLANPAVDAVVISTPSHWHIPIGLAAVHAGKDVYGEKPLGYSLSQDRAMLEACQKHNRIFQHGTQQRAQELLKRGVELVRNGYIGELQRVVVWAPTGSFSGGSLEEIPVPQGLDYELYIGPAPMKPCTKDRITRAATYACADYTQGNLSEWGPHPMDIAIWGMNADTKGPFSVRGTGHIKTPEGLFNTYNTWDVEIRFANGVPMHFISHDVSKKLQHPQPEWYSNGTTFFGAEGWVSLSREGAAASNPEWLKMRQCKGDNRVRYSPKYYKSFVESVRDRTPSMAPIEDAVRCDALIHLSCLAIKNNAEVVWDPQKFQIVSPAPLNEQMTRPMRGNWLTA